MRTTTFILTCLSLTIPCSAVIITVDDDAPADFDNIQMAIKAAGKGDEIVLADGTYTGPGNRDIDFLHKAITLRSENGPQNCIIDCESLGRGFWLRRNETATSVIQGITITNGNQWLIGAGIYCDSSSPTIIDCIITRNGGANYGGGVAMEWSSKPTIRDCTISNNWAKFQGAGLYIAAGSRAIVSNCIISGNELIGGNVGGGIFVELYGRLTLSNSIIIGNSSDSHGAGICFGSWNYQSTVTNCTIAFNAAAESGGGILCSSSSPTLTNCVVWGNTAPIGPQIRVVGSCCHSERHAHLTISYSDVQDGESAISIGHNASLDWGWGNINANPLFLDPGYWADANEPNFVTHPNDPNAVWILGDYRLHRTSPCIDAGTNAGVYKDIEGNVRPYDYPDVDNNGELPDFDIGAYEAVYTNASPLACIVSGSRTVATGIDCQARVMLDGSCSTDVDSLPGTNDDINDFDWYEVVDVCDANSDIFLGSGEVIECNLGLGEHLIILEVTDKAGAFDTNEVVITVEDVTPPELSLSVEPNVLWPPNNKMVLVTPGWEVSDNCDEEVEVSLVDITMSAEGDVNDYVQIGGDGSIYLRARKGGGRAVRIYTLTYQAVDDSGNAAIGSATVAVPHNQR